MTDELTYKISAHCKERYAERIMDKESSNDINRFIVENDDKIKTDINKLINHGEVIYSGKQSHKNKNSIITVYLKDEWVILVDIKTSLVITLFKIDLGVDDEFNKLYISKMLDKLNTYKRILEDVQLQVYEETNMYRELINDTETQIKEYRAMIKNLEELCDGYKSIINNNTVRIAQANKDVVDVVNQLIGKKEF